VSSEEIKEMKTQFMINVEKLLAKPKNGMDFKGGVRDKVIIDEVFADIVQSPPPQDPYSKFMFQE
jgi:hypothetical protein